MNIVLTTIILFVVFGVLLFMGVPISVSIIVSSIVTAMSTLSWDQITFNYHAEDEFRYRKFFPAGGSAVHPCR